MKMKLVTTEEELELAKTQSLKALEEERHRCSEEIERMRNAFSERLSEGHEREVAMSEEISQLQVGLLFAPPTPSLSPSLLVLLSSDAFSLVSQSAVSDGFLAVASFELKLKQRSLFILPSVTEPHHR
jgi:hypothetical protein